MISPVNSPPEKVKGKEEMEDIQLVFCTSDQNKASKLAKRNFPHSQFLSVVKRNPHHFNFLSKLNFSVIPDVIESIDKLKIVHFRTLSDKKTYTPKERHHCQDCQVHRSN